MITINKDKFALALRNCAKVTGGRKTLPILSNARLDTVTNNIWLTVTDLDQTLIAGMECSAVGEATTTFPVRDVARALSTLKKMDSVTLQPGEKNVLTLNGALTFLGLPADDFPTAPKGEFHPLYTLKQRDLKRLLRHVANAISTDESRYVLNGVLIQRRVKECTTMFVATDGRHLVCDGRRQLRRPPTGGISFAMDAANSAVSTGAKADSVNHLRGVTHRACKGSESLALDASRKR